MVCPNLIIGIEAGTCFFPIVLDLKVRKPDTPMAGDYHSMGLIEPLRVKEKSVSTIATDWDRKLWKIGGIVSRGGFRGEEIHSRWLFCCEEEVYFVFFIILFHN